MRDKATTPRISRDPRQGWLNLPAELRRLPSSVVEDASEWPTLAHKVKNAGKFVASHFGRLEEQLDASELIAICERDFSVHANAKSADD